MYLEISELSKTIGGANVLQHVSLQMERGRIYGLWGAESSTLLRILCGRCLPTAGEVIIDGERLGRDISFPRSLGMFIAEDGFVPHYSGRKNLELAASVQGQCSKKKIAAVMNELGFSPGDRKKFTNCSPAKQQLLGIAAAVIHDPDIIVLEDLACGMNDTVKAVLLRRKARGALIILSGQNKEMLEYYADEIICMESGMVQETYSLAE